MSSKDAIRLRDLSTGDAGWLIQQHAEHYFVSDGFDAGFEALVAEVLADFIRNRDPATDRAWIAVRGTERLGSIFCVRDGARAAKLRLFYLVPAARGTGLGRRLLETCIAHARGCGFAELRLWTHESHRAAGRLYRAAGFDLLASEAVHDFGQDLVRQNWRLRL